jgi:hypothetical protein
MRGMFVALINHMLYYISILLTIVMVVQRF